MLSTEGCGEWEGEWEGVTWAGEGGGEWWGEGGGETSDGLRCVINVLRSVTLDAVIDWFWLREINADKASPWWSNKLLCLRIT